MSVLGAAAQWWLVCVGLGGHSPVVASVLALMAVAQGGLVCHDYHSGVWYVSASWLDSSCASSNVRP